MKILKFGADWCGPCAALQKVLDGIENLPIEVEQIDIDGEDSRIRTMGIRGVPTMIKVDDAGKELSRVVGAISQQEILEWIN